MQKRWKRILSALVMTGIMAGILWAGCRALEKEYVFWNGTILPRHAQSLSITGKQMRDPEAFLKFTDLRQLDARDTGMTAEQYAWFRRELPGCRVLWDVPLQGHYYSQDTEELQVAALTEEEMDVLEYLPSLKRLDVGDWNDYSRIRALKQRYPLLQIHYRVEIGGEQWDSDVVSLLLENPSAEELMEKLCLFEDLESVLLTGTIPERGQLQQLQNEYPDIFFLWKMNALGLSLETDMETLDLSGTAVDSVAELEKLLPYFPKLKQVQLNGYSLPQEELAALARRNPGIQFVFDLMVGDRIFSTDAREIDLSNMPLEDTVALEAVLPCFHNLEKVVMCRCGISDEEMAALNQRYEEIAFVWSVNLAGMEFRTDSVHFTPNKWGLVCDNENIAGLKYCTEMVCVDIGHQGMVSHCEWVRNMPDLKYLILAETGISDLTPLENHKNLVFLEIFLSKVTDYSPLTTCKALEDLNLCYTKGDPEPIGEMTWLKRLWWTGSWLGRTYLADKLPDTYAEYLSPSSTGKGWREGQHYYDMRDFIGMDYMVG